ncbi:MAG: VIT1/CCC1 transporter family protein [Verrucomicrobiota bacterium]
MSHHSEHAAEHTPEAIRDRLSSGVSQDYLKDSVYGAIDGAVTTFAVVSSVAGAGLSSGIVVVLGLANLLADGISMASGNFIGTRAENQAADKAKREEELEVEHHPEGEREEIRQIFSRKGFEGETLEKVVEVITADKSRWVRIMLQEEHGIGPDRPRALRAAIVTFVSFILIGAIPLAAYLADLIQPGLVERPFAVACILTAISFAIIGSFKARVVGLNQFKGVLETLSIGALASGLAYGIGYLLRPFAEGL